MADLGRPRVGEPYVDLRRQPQRETRRRQKRSGASHALAALNGQRNLRFAGTGGYGGNLTADLH